MRGNGTNLHGSKNLAREVAALKAQLKSLTEALESEAGETASRTVDKIESKSREAIDHAIEAAQAFIDEQAEAALEAARSLGKKSSKVREAATESLIETVQARPLSTLAAVVGIGFLAGYLCRRH